MTRLRNRAQASRSPLTRVKTGSSGVSDSRHSNTVAHKYKLLCFTLNVAGLRSDFTRLHSKIPSLLGQFPVFTVTFLSCTVNSLAFTLKFLAFIDSSSPSL